MPDLPPEVVNALDIPDEETALQAGARTGAFPPPATPSIERFPYYTAFPFGWYAAAYSHEVPAGGVVSRRRLARDLVVFRGDDGVVSVMDAHCPHRGANLAVGGEVRGCTVVCPYHWWAWDGQGRNVAIPYRDEPVIELRIRAYPTVEVSGFVLFWYHPDPTQEPLWEIPAFDQYTTAEWTDLAPFACEYHCPWQEVAENYPDNVHLRVVHGSPSVPAVERLEFDGFFHTLDATFELVTADGPVRGRMRTEAYGPGFTVVRSSSIIESVFCLATTPTDWERTTSLMGYRMAHVGHDASARAYEAAIIAELLAELAKQWSEDIAIFDNKVHVADLGSAPEDEAARSYRRWAEQFYVDGDPIAADRVARRNRL